MTAPISGSSVCFNPPDELDAHPSQPAAAPPPPPRLSDSQSNRVGAWSGQAPTEATSDSAPSSSGMTAGMLARGQLPTRSADDVLPQLDKLMLKDGYLRDLRVTKADAREAVALLEQLPPKEYQKALNQMDGQTMSQLFSEMDGDTRKSFFAQARQKGAIAEEPSVKLPPREGSPPDKPALLRNDGAQRLELREAIHAENKSRTSQYMQDFDGYVSRYSEAALKAPTPLALRVMGPPMSEFVLYEPGLIGKDYQTFGTLDQGAAIQRARAAKAANDRISDFAGRTRAGSYSVTASAKLKADVAGVGFELKHNEKVTAYGAREANSGAEAMLEVADGASLGVDQNGKLFEELHLGGLKLKAEGGQLTKVEGKVAGLGISREEGKTTLSTSAGGAPIGGYATIDEKKGSYGGGLKFGPKLELEGVGELELSVKVGFEVQGVAPERLPDIASMKDDGIWGPMPELDNRVKWNAIPAERRERLARDGWSPSNWPVH